MGRLRGAGALLLLPGAFWSGSRGVFRWTLEYSGHFRAVPVVKTVKNQWYFNDSQIWLLELSGAQEAPERASGTSSGRFRRVPGMLGLPSGGPLGRLGCMGIAPGRSPVTVRCSSGRFGALTGRFANR